MRKLLLLKLLALLMVAGCSDQSNTSPQSINSKPPSELQPIPVKNQIASTQTFEIRGIRIGMTFDEVEKLDSSVWGCSLYPTNEYKDITDETPLACLSNFYGEARQLKFITHNKKIILIEIPMSFPDGNIPDGSFVALTDKFAATPKVDVKKTSDSEKRDNPFAHDFTYVASMQDKDGNSLSIQGAGNYIKEGKFIDIEPNNRKGPYNTFKTYIRLEAENFSKIKQLQQESNREIEKARTLEIEKNKKGSL